MNTELTIREKITILLVAFLIRMLKPWQYDHHFDSFWKELWLLAGSGIKEPDKNV